MANPTPTPEPTGSALSAARDFPTSWAVFTLSRTHKGMAAALLGELGLFPGQELILMQLWEEEGLSQKCLGAPQKLDHSTIAKSIRRLEAAGLVRRERSAEDARVSLVFLTDAGRALEPAVHDVWTRMEAFTTSNLTADERDTLVRLAAKVVGE